MVKKSVIYDIITKGVHFKDFMFPKVISRANDTIRIQDQTTRMNQISCEKWVSSKQKGANSPASEWSENLSSEN